MTASRRSSRRSSERPPIGSNLAKVDAHVIGPEEYDELPEVTDAWIAGAVLHENGKRLDDGREPADTGGARQPVTLHLDSDVLAGLRATGAGWDGRVNDVLRAWLRGRERRDA